jgi:hypothetical protein
MTLCTLSIARLLFAMARNAVPDARHHGMPLTRLRLTLNKPATRPHAMKTHYLVTFEQSPNGERERTVICAWDAGHAEDRLLGQFEAEGGNEGVTVLDVYRLPVVRRPRLLSEGQYRARFSR